MDYIVQYRQGGRDQTPAGDSRAEPAAIGDVVPGPMDMLTYMWKHQRTQQAKEDKGRAWHRDLPKVSVKPSYLSRAGGPAKGEIVDGRLCKRADWPPEF